jgi:hypothetical protein
MPSEEWYYQSMGREIGPVSAAQLVQLAKRGDISPETSLRKGAFGNWANAARVRGLFPQAAALPVATATALPFSTAPEPDPEPTPMDTPVSWSDSKPTKRKTNSAAESKRKYRSARIFVRIYWIFGAIIFALWLAPFLAMLAFQEIPPTLGPMLLVSIAGGGSMLVTAEMMSAFLDMAENSWQANEMLKALLIRSSVEGHAEE